MITIRKLARLPAGTRHRTVTRLLERWTHEGSPPDSAYTGSVLVLIRDDETLPEAVRRQADALSAIPPAAQGEDRLLRGLDTLRYLMLQHLGLEPAEWDLAPVRSLATGSERRAAPSLTGVQLYLESLRSPFNVGSIVRTAAAFGVSTVIVSEDCPRLDHPRLVRSAMGALDSVEIERGSLEEGAPHPLIALETGGEPLAGFRFPESGTLLLGSEELGLSPELLARAAARVAIPMPGAKASLNVGVACGIALGFWQAALMGS